MTKLEFIKLWGNKARDRYNKGYTILPSLVITQAILESGWGTSSISKALNNYHGIKWYNDSVCRPYEHTSCITWEEYSKGNITNLSAEFCKFKTIDEELDCYYAWLKRPKDAYKKLWSCTDFYEASELIRQGGYATDFSYTEKLRKIYKEYETFIKQYDDMCVGKYYRVQIGAFYNKDYAIRLAHWIYDNLIKLGCNIKPIIKYYDNMYHVQMGAYSSFDNARNLSNWVFNNLNVNTYITNKNGEDVYYD